MQVEVQFLPDNITVLAEVGEPLLQVSQRAGVEIPTGCLSGACHACEIEIMGQDIVCACISGVPAGRSPVVISLHDDPAW
jgi:ferredoxin